MFTLRSFAAGLLLAIALPASAAELSVENPWVREPPPGAMATGGFMVLKNTGAGPVSVVSARSEGAGWVEIHKTIEKDGVARMVEQKSLDIAPGGQLELKPGSYHLMMMEPKKLRDGDRVNITIKFDDGSEQTIQAPVKRMLGGKAMQHKCGAGKCGGGKCGGGK